MVHDKKIQAGINLARGISFYFLASLVTLVIGIVFLPVFFLKKVNIKASKLWANTLLALLRYVCKVNIKIIGKENIPKAPFIVVSKHQSALETLVLYLLFPKPVFILKKELLFIPFVGMYLKKLGAIVIDRSRGRNAILRIQEQLKNISNESCLIIFPEGTRTNPGEYVTKYNSGIAMMYETLKWSILPIAVNTGAFWSKTGSISSGTAIIKILPLVELPKKYDRKKFLKQLNEIIETESIELYKYHT